MSEDPYPYKEIGRRLKALRGDLSQGEFARGVGVVQQQYGRYEKGRRRPPIDILARVATKTGASIDWILTGQKPRMDGLPETLDVERPHSLVKESTAPYFDSSWPGIGDKIKAAVAALDNLNSAAADAGLTIEDRHRSTILEYLFLTHPDRLGLDALLGLLASVDVIKPKD